MIEIGVL